MSGQLGLVECLEMFQVCCTIESLAHSSRGSSRNNAMCQNRASWCCFRARVYAALVSLRGNCKSAKAGLRPLAARDRTAGSRADKLYRTATWRVGVFQRSVEDVTSGDLRHLKTAQLSASVNVITAIPAPIICRLSIRTPESSIGLAPTWLSECWKIPLAATGFADNFEKCDSKPRRLWRTPFLTWRRMCNVPCR